MGRHVQLLSPSGSLTSSTVPNISSDRTPPSLPVSLGMVEPFGIVAGAVGIAAAFTVCVDCFEYI